jgi:glycosyltransferase involved in cell wall biosynthesis
MLIGIDASRAVRSTVTGTERYSREIIRNLLLLPRASEHRWRLYVDKEPDSDLFPLGPNGSPEELSHIEVCNLPRINIWSHRTLGPEVVSHPPDVLFVPSHVVPFTLAPSRLPPTVVTVHDLGYHALPGSHTFRQRQYLTWSTRWSTSAATLVIAVSQATAADVLRHYVRDPNKIRVIHEAAGEWRVPSQTAMDEVKAVYQLQRPYALYVGTIQPRKNVARLIEAYTLLADEEAVTWDLVIAGGAGWLSEPIFDLVRTSRFADRIHLTGYVPEEHLAPLLAGASFFCYPSLFEGFGLPVLEAQTAGVPVLTTYSSSLPEVAGDAAILVDPTDVGAIAAAMLQLSEDEELRQKLIAAGYENIKRFSWEKAASETLAVLEEAAQSK